MRKPRLNSAVATVAVEMPLSLLRVASLSFAMSDLSPFVIPGCAPWRRPGIHTHDGGYGFRVRGFAAPRNDGVNRSTALRLACQSRSRGNRNRSLHWPA